MTDHDHDHSHDHGSCAAGAADALGRAEEVCASRGARLTPIRAKVLAALADSATPVGAYELMDRLAEDGRRPAPITVYRALDFLLTNGLVHRLESRNAYLACDHTHDAHAPVIFLICDSCGEVSEASSDDVADGLSALLAKVGFKARSQLVEVAGECANCRGGQGRAAGA
ncbi:transcriptional repressor [Agaricicola taiwanensis]|uniref:Transcriptional repressor n=1 Tax=Agaricicola taiwanensis TaxID=591372 RepID=A0A8J2YKV3_9RHOB|nr:transcriptional repressor [Agaricicola taiwanensis]GGE50700.1 transcriptional repressor [Agaricicola taiwanensis]